MRIGTGLFAFILFSSGLSAQQIVPRENRRPEDQYIEQYFVLKDDTLLKHGPYRKVNYFTGEVMLFGFYNRNKRDSTWQEYCLFGNFVQSTGKYARDRRIGEWTFYRQKNDVEQKYDYNTQTITFFKFDTGARKLLLDPSGKKTTQVDLERPAMYIGGKLAVMSYIAQNLKYPDSAYRHGIHGMVEVAVNIDKNGRPGRVWVSKSVHPMLDEAALDVMNAIPPNWVPAMYKGKAVASVFFIEVPFLPF